MTSVRIWPDSIPVECDGEQKQSAIYFAVHVDPEFKGSLYLDWSYHFFEMIFFVRWFARSLYSRPRICSSFILPMACTFSYFGVWSYEIVLINFPYVSTPVLILFVGLWSVQGFSQSLRQSSTAEWTPAFCPYIPSKRRLSCSPQKACNWKTDTASPWSQKRERWQWRFVWRTYYARETKKTQNWPHNWSWF